jgi:hypothetical protein
LATDKEMLHTREWDDKTIGERYNEQLDYYNSTDLNWLMYNDRQWVGVKSKELPRFQVNVCKQSANYLIASILSRPLKAEYNADNIPEPLPDSTDPQDVQNRNTRTVISNLTKAADMKWEKEKMHSKIRRLLLDAACSGDMCCHVFWDGKDFRTEVLDGACVLFGNPNTHHVESQPYIQIVGREVVSVLKREAKEAGVSQREIDKITSDTETERQIGERGKIELEGKADDQSKATYIIRYWRDEKTGNIFWNKSTKFCNIRSKIDLGISRYPIVWGNWETVKYSYHGNSLIGGIVDNQISINQMYAMIVYWMRMSAFGKVIVDSTKIPQGRYSNKLGEVIYADGDVSNIVKQLEAGQFNSAILTVLDKAEKVTKEVLGANEAALGNINPERASGTAIMMTAKQAAIPHANILENLQQFVEDLYLVWGEFFQKKYGNRSVFYHDDKLGMQSFRYDADSISDAVLSCKVNVGPSTLWSEPMLLNNLDNLLKMQAITPSQYFERVKSMNIIPDIQGLIADAKLREVMEAQQKQLEQQMAMAQGQPPDAGAPSWENNPELQGAFGGTAQNSLRASQPMQG